MRNILLTGAKGQVGWELQRSLAPLGNVFAFSQDQLDLANSTAIVNKVRETKPQIIVNAAAYTAVDQAENEREKAFRINAEAPGVLAEEAKNLDSIFIHYSTDYVFDGKASKPYREEDFPHPLNVYGRSKLAGEKAVEAVGGKFLILRTSWIYGMRGKNFLLTMLRLAQEKKALKVVNDQIGAPTWSRLIAETSTQMIVSCMNNDSWGIYHATSNGSTNWYHFAKTIFQKYHEKHPEFLIPSVEPVPSSEYLQTAQRPKYSVLSNEKLKKTFGLELPSWEKGLSLAIDQL